MDLQIDYIQLDELRALLEAWPAESETLFRNFVIECSATLKKAIQSNAPSITGKLRSSVHVISVGTTSSAISITAPYAGYVIDGAPAHTISPLTKQALYWPNADHPVKSVNHPGQKPNDFVSKGIEDASPIIDTQAYLLLDELIGLL